MKQTKLLSSALSLLLVLTLLMQVAVLPVSAQDDTAEWKTVGSYAVDHTLDPRGRLMDVKGVADTGNLPSAKALDPSIYTDTEASMVKKIANVLLARNTEPFTLHYKTNRVLKKEDVLGWYYQAIATLPRYDQYCMTICYYTFAYYETSSANYFDITYEIEYYLTPAQETELNEKIDQILDLLDVYDKSEIDKLLATYEYLVRSVTYNLEAVRCYTAYGALIDKECVCQGYALALMRLLLALNVDIDVVVGQSNGENHMWNLIRLDGVEYLLDSTWDSGNSIPCYFWFLKGSEDFRDHTPTDPYSANMSTKNHEQSLYLSHTWVYDETAQRHKCHFCNLMYPVMGHTLTTMAGIAPSCITSGLTEGQYCTICDMVVTPRQVIPPTGHSYQTEILAETTCTEDGIRRHTCPHCGDGYTETIAATGHSLVLDKGLAPTCTASGLTEGYHCDTCNTVLVAQDSIPATGHSVIIHEAVPPTCTNSGVTEGQFCTSCNTVLVAQETVGRLGHEYTYADNGNGTHSGHCIRCDKTTSAAAHAFTGGVCVCGETTVDESIQILHTLNLASDISISFVVPATALSSYDSYYMECVLPKYEGNELTGSSIVQIPPVANGSYYYFTLTGITAVQMGDMVEAVLHMYRGNVEYRSETDRYSVATYAYHTLNNNSNTKMLTLCADLLRYGAEAQSYKKYRTDALVDARMTDLHRTYLSDTSALHFNQTNSLLGDEETPVIKWVGKTLDLGSKVGIKFVFNAKDYVGEIAALSMRITYTDSRGEIKTLNLTNADAYSPANSYYSFTFYGLLASELRTVVDVAIYDGDIRLSETLRYSAETYAAGSATGLLEPLCRALFAYSDSAKAFFAK